jgi:hypothetical protein
VDLGRHQRAPLADPVCTQARPAARSNC